MQARARVEVERVGGEVLQLRERLEAGVAAPDEHEREQGVEVGGVVRRVGELERLDHVVAQPDRVGKRLEADGVLLEARHRHDARDRPVRDQQPVVAQLVLLTLEVADGDRAPGSVARGDGAEDQASVAEHVAKRCDHVTRLQRAGRRLRQERRVQHEVDVVYERDARAVRRHRALELPRRVEPAKAASGDDDVPSHGAMLKDCSGFPAGLRSGARGRLLSRPLETLEAPEARRHLVSAEEPPAHLAVDQSVPGRPLSGLAQLGEEGVACSIHP